jgi:hypothetical protein
LCLYYRQSGGSVADSGEVELEKNDKI